MKKHVETYWAILIWRKSHAPYFVRDDRVSGLTDMPPRFFETRKLARDYVRGEAWPEGAGPTIVRVQVAEVKP